MAVYVLRTWKTKPGVWREFQELSHQDIWPALEAAGAKIIGLWTTIIGDGNEEERAVQDHAPNSPIFSQGARNSLGLSTRAWVDSVRAWRFRTASAARSQSPESTPAGGWAAQVRVRSHIARSS